MNSVIWLRRLFDAFVIIVQVSYGLSMVMIWTVANIPIGYGINLFLFMFISYLLRFGVRFQIGKLIKSSKLLSLFLFIYIFDILQNAVLLNPVAFPRLFLFLDIILFIEYLYACYIEQGNRGYARITEPYLVYSVYNVLVVILLFFFIILGILSITDNPLEENILIKDNLDAGGGYFFPGHISIVTREARSLSDFGIPMITGLSHEPHVLAYLIFPSLFLLLYKIPNKIYLITLCYILYFSVAILGQSSTAILVLSATVFLDIIWRTKGKNGIITVLLLLGLIAIIILKSRTVIDLVQTMVFDKISTETGSLDYSASMLDYVLSPSNIIGTGNIPNATGSAVKSQDVGFITCILDIFFYVFLCIESFRLYRSREAKYHFIGLAVIYFSLHTLKMSYLTFSYPYSAFIIFCLCVFNKEKQHSCSKLGLQNSSNETVQNIPS